MVIVPVMRAHHHLQSRLIYVTLRLRMGIGVEETVVEMTLFVHSPVVTGNLVRQVMDHASVSVVAVVLKRVI